MINRLILLILIPICFSCKNFGQEIVREKNHFIHNTKEYKFKELRCFFENDTKYLNQFYQIQNHRSESITFTILGVGLFFHGYYNVSKFNDKVGSDTPNWGGLYLGLIELISSGVLIRTSIKQKTNGKLALDKLLIDYNSNIINELGFDNNQLEYNLYSIKYRF